MHRVLSRGLIIALLLNGAVFAQAQSEQSQSEQSLGELARAHRANEQAREAAGAVPKEITNQDLPSDSEAITETKTSEPMTAVSGVIKPSRYEDQRLSNRLEAEQRAAGQWKSRIQEQENRIADLQARIDRVNASVRAAVGTAQYEGPANRYQAVQSERLAAMYETLEQQKRRLAMMQDAARRAGMGQ
jgi:chromosome segregation ATPase